MDAYVNIGGTDTYELRKALLIYEKKSVIGSSDTSTAVTVHDVARGRIEAGKPITFSAVESLAAALGRNLSACYLPSNVISLSFSKVAWFCPAARRRVWFKPDGRFDGGAEEKGKELSESMKTLKLNGRFAHHPPLLFVAQTNNLSVFALERNERPAANTRLHRAPYWNLWENGGMCQGNRRLANAPTVSAIPACEDAFFNSDFSHTNLRKIVNHPAGHFGLWNDLCKFKKAPDHRYWSAHLIPLNITVADALKGLK